MFFCGSRKPRQSKRKQTRRGFSLIEVLIVLGILSILSTLAIPKLFSALYAVKLARAVADINALNKDITQYNLQKGAYPATLADIGRSTMNDPWGNPYQYLNLSAAGAAGQERIDRFGVRINTNYDVYSLGLDAQSAPDLTSGLSQDDVIFAADSGYYGLASEF